MLKQMSSLQVMVLTTVQVFGSHSGTVEDSSVLRILGMSIGFRAVQEEFGASSSGTWYLPICMSHVP
jgi:hypothetical protein